MARRTRKNPSVSFRTIKAHVESDPGTIASDNPNMSESSERNVSSRVLESGGKKPKKNPAPKNERKPVRGLGN